MKTLIAQTVKVLTAVSVNKDLMAMASLVKVKTLIHFISKHPSSLVKVKTLINFISKHPS